MVLDSQQRVFRLDPHAQAAGIRCGMTLSSARGILPQLLSQPREERQEREVLRSLAAWAMQFSSRISLSGSDALLLEIGGSLRLFGGLDALCQRIATGLDELGYSASPGIAPTPRGAEVLAHGHNPQPALDMAQLQQQIQTLPLAGLNWDARSLQRFDAIGISRIGQCLALPRDGFLRRYGAAHLKDLDRLTGRSADPRALYEPPPTFDRSLDVIGDMTDISYLLPGFEHLFSLLQAELQGRDRAVQRLHIEMSHRAHPPSRIDIGMQRANCDATHWLNLLNEHLQRHPLVAPVRTISVRAQDFVEPARQQQDLWQNHNLEQRQLVLERLTARLGPAALYALQACATHVPECASQRAAAGQGQALVQTETPRPLWLLPSPQRIEFSHLQLCSQAERLESGWWDAHCQRDYYRARDRLNRQLWVYRDHQQPSHWYIHGFFA